MKLKLILSYDGSRFLGSATQPHQNSVQDTLAEALKHLGIFTRPLFASRTDKGVHALCNVASIECGGHFKDFTALQNKLNFHLKPFVFIRKIEPVSADFEVRFSAKKRAYIYAFNHSLFKPNLSAYYHFYPKFDISKAQQALRLFEGEHDFAFFKKGELDKNTARIVFNARAFGFTNLSFFRFEANGFLRAQIRLSTAAILKVLEGRLSLESLKAQIDKKELHSRTLAPASGLYLSRIFY